MWDKYSYKRSDSQYVRGDCVAAALRDSSTNVVIVAFLLTYQRLTESAAICPGAALYAVLSP